MLKHTFQHVTPPFATKPVLYRAHGVYWLLPAGRELVKTGDRWGLVNLGTVPSTQAGWQIWSEESTRGGIQHGPW